MPDDAKKQQALKSAAEELRSAANLAATNALKNQILSNLQVGRKYIDINLLIMCIHIYMHTSMIYLAFHRS